jgi:hypothetical protein
MQTLPGPLRALPPAHGQTQLFSIGKLPSPFARLVAYQKPDDEHGGIPGRCYLWAAARHMVCGRAPVESMGRGSHLSSCVRPLQDERRRPLLRWHARHQTVKTGARPRRLTHPVPVVAGCCRFFWRNDRDQANEHTLAVGDDHSPALKCSRPESCPPPRPIHPTDGRAGRILRGGHWPLA